MSIEVNIPHLLDLANQQIVKNPDGALYISAQIVRELIDRASVSDHNYSSADRWKEKTLEFQEIIHDLEDKRD